VIEALDGADTFPKLLARNAERLGGRAALREKDLGIWRETSWRSYHERVRDFSLGLVALGLARSGKVAIIGDNRPEWVIAELAAQAAGAASVGIYQDSNLNEVAYVIDHCDAAFVVAEDQEQVDKILGMIERLPKVRAIIYSDSEAIDHFASQPRGHDRNDYRCERCHDGSGWRQLGVIATQHPTHDKERQHNDVSHPVPQPDPLGPSATRDGKPIEPTRNGSC
jgi:long-subunit acyl-CoA synthetase (AMP-forming)